MIILLVTMVMNYRASPEESLLLGEYSLYAIFCELVISECLYLLLSLLTGIMIEPPK